MFEWAHCNFLPGDMGTARPNASPQQGSEQVPGEGLFISPQMLVGVLPPASRAICTTHLTPGACPVQG